MFAISSSRWEVMLNLCCRLFFVKACMFEMYVFVEVQC